MHVVLNFTFVKICLQFIGLQFLWNGSHPNVNQPLPMSWTASPACKISNLNPSSFCGHPLFKVYRTLTVSVKPAGAALGQLVGGRISVSILALSYFTSAITIAVRYSAVRRQFGPGDKEELSVIEYQLQVSQIAFYNVHFQLSID